MDKRVTPLWDEYLIKINHEAVIGIDGEKSTIYDLFWEIIAEFKTVEELIEYLKKELQK